jgi:hypothetical protein
MTKAFIYNVSIIHMGKVPQQFVIVMTAAAAATIVIWISTLVMGMIPQAAYAQQDEVNPSSSLSSDVDDIVHLINSPQE